MCVYAIAIATCDRAQSAHSAADRVRMFAAQNLCFLLNRIGHINAHTHTLSLNRTMVASVVSSTPRVGRRIAQVPKHIHTLRPRRRRRQRPTRECTKYSGWPRVPSETQDKRSICFPHPSHVWLFQFKLSHCPELWRSVAGRNTQSRTHAYT